MTAPAPEAVEQDMDFGQNLAHYMCAGCNGEPMLGRVYRALCGARKEYRGPNFVDPVCAVCSELHMYRCERCSP